LSNGDFNGTSGEDKLVFAILGDYGIKSSFCEQEANSLIKKLQKDWHVDFVITMGDNNYWTGTCDQIEDNIGMFSEYFSHGTSCKNPDGKGTEVHFQNNSTTDIRFFPSLGNHDWDNFHKYGVKNLPYTQYLNYLPSFNTEVDGQYYRIDPTKTINRKPKLKGLVELFALNSNLGKKGADQEEAVIQQKWVMSSLAASTARWKLVYFHHSPFTTAKHDPPGIWMDLPFQKWGASAVLTGHEHTYERIFKNGTFPYVVNGLSGHPWIYEITGPDCTPEPGSRVRYNKAHGVGVGVISRKELRLCFYSVENGITKVDDFGVL